MELIRGDVADRPWGQTLGALGARKLTGQLTLRGEDGKEYCVAFERGAVIGATSPVLSDSAARVALTQRVIGPSQVPQIARVIAANPDRDDIDVLAKASGLDAEVVQRLRPRIIAQRAARTYSVDRGSFVIDDVVTISTSAAVAIDVRSIVYLGAQLNLSEQRLASDLRRFGTLFTLKPDSIDELPQFGLTTSERPILEALRRGATLAELEAEHRELDPRTVQAVIYALVSCLACDADLAGARTGPEAARSPSIASSFDATPRPPGDRLGSRTSTPPPARPPTASTLEDVTIAPPRVITSRMTPPLDRADTSSRENGHEVTRPRTITEATQPAGVRASIPPARRATTTAPAMSRAVTPSTAPAMSRAVTPSTAPAMSRAVTPPTAPAMSRAAAPSRSPDVHLESTGSRRIADPLSVASEAYQRGQSALHDDQIPVAIEELTRATELNPHEFLYHATLAWAQFCGATDKAPIADKVRKMLGHAVLKSMTPELPRLYLGRMERMLGRDREALRHFQQVLEIQPHNADAASEIRSIETRLAAGSGEKPGLGSLFGRKKS